MTCLIYKEFWPFHFYIGKVLAPSMNAGKGPNLKFSFTLTKGLTPSWLTNATESCFPLLDITHISLNLFEHAFLVDTADQEMS